MLDAIEHEKTLTLSEKVANSKGDSKKLYALVSKLTGTKSENPMPSGISDSTLSDNFADYLLKKISKMRDSLNEFDKYKPLNKSAPVLDKFKELSQDEVKLLIGDLNTKSCELDILPTHVLKQYLTQLLPTIT